MSGQHTHVSIHIETRHGDHVIDTQIIHLDPDSDVELTLEMGCEFPPTRPPKCEWEPWKPPRSQLYLQGKVDRYEWNGEKSFHWKDTYEHPIGE